MRGYAMPKCARLGCLAGGAVVQVVGAEMTPEAWRWLFARSELHLMPCAPMYRHPSLPAMLCTFVAAFRAYSLQTVLHSNVVCSRPHMASDMCIGRCHRRLMRRLQLHCADTEPHAQIAW